MELGRLGEVESLHTNWAFPPHDRPQTRTTHRLATTGGDARNGDLVVKGLKCHDTQKRIL